MFREAEGKDKWMMERRGKFTGSECYKLLKEGGKNEMFAPVGLTYIEEKAMELCTNVFENGKLDNVKGFLHGRRYEEPAFRHYKRVTGNSSMRYFGTDHPLFLEHDKDSGCSPDGLMGEGQLIHLGLEIKCPESPKTHWNYCKFKDQWDLKENVIEHYAQCQMLILVTKAPMVHWVSFDERYKDERKKMKLLEILPESKFLDTLEIRLMQAARERDRMIYKFLNS